MGEFFRVSRVPFSFLCWIFMASAPLACGWWGDGEMDHDDEAILIVPGGAAALPEMPDDPEQMARLSAAYRQGRGVAQDDGLAFEWARRAAEAGHVGAMNDLGQMYEIGIAGEIDNSAAVRWYRKAAELGSAAAQHSLASMLRDGRGVEIDEASANAWLRRAAEYGHPSAAGELASLIWHGEIPARFTAEGCFWWLVAVREGLEAPAERCLEETPGMTREMFRVLDDKAGAWVSEAGQKAGHDKNGDG
ncbi:MAG: tetratricopeptide repeat protein [Paracoccaceae bacterium]